ncbi:MAG: HDOD domain-containing protein, partial [Spirochaetes bacterium]|nr:HDOD domain-containing protein [Spirochaetota bacterium]
MDLVNTSEIVLKFEKGENAFISFHFHNESLMKSIEAVIVKILSKHDLAYLLDPINTILREVITNAVKANAKRFYFQKQNLDINNPETYNTGVIGFKNDMIERFMEIEDELSTSRFIADISFEKIVNGMSIIVKNNTPIHPEELKRIYLRIEKAKTYHDFSEAYGDIYDDSEGAGLGLVLTILLLKNTGIGEDSFRIESSEHSTYARLDIPYQLKPRDITTAIKDQILNDINGLPAFPENVLVLQRLCRERHVQIEKIVEKIMMDPALTADILKLANSAYFTGIRKIENLNEAVVRIGLKNLYNLLIVTASRRILEQRYKMFAEIWKHCSKVAAYARDIAMWYNLNNIKDNAFLGGLLHDLGKIILLATDKKFSAWIENLMANRKIRTSTVLEEITLGISHSVIGEVMAGKWGFPEYLIEAIRFHHAPLCGSNKNRDLIYTVYLANMLCGIEARKYHFFY